MIIFEYDFVLKSIKYIKMKSISIYFNIDKKYTSYIYY